MPNGIIRLTGSLPSTAPNWNRSGARGSRKGCPSRSWPSSPPCCWSWAVLATVYFLPVWLLGFLTNRDLNFRGSWKLSGAALLPGALLMTAGILLYDFGALDLVQFGFLFAAHLALAWIYLFFSQLFLPRMESEGAAGKSVRARRPFIDTGTGAFSLRPCRNCRLNCFWRCVICGPNGRSFPSSRSSPSSASRSAWPCSSSSSAS